MFILRYLKLLSVIIIGLWSALFGGINTPVDSDASYSVTLCAYSEAEYEIINDNDKFKLSSPEGEASFATLYEALEEVPEGECAALASVRAEGGVISKGITLSGELEITSGNLTVDSSGVVFDGLSVELSAGYLRIRDGALCVLSGDIRSYTTDTVVLDYNSSSELILSGGSIISEYGYAIKNTLGKICLSGGNAESRAKAAVYNASSLILSSGKISGQNIDVSTSVPIRLSSDGSYYSEYLTLEYRESLIEGKINTIANDASSPQAKLITLIDKDARERELSFTENSDKLGESCFLSVNLPYKISFYQDAAVINTLELYEDEILSAPDDPELLGYLFSGWYTDYTLTEKYSFGTAPNGEVNLFAGFSLLPPSFEISSLSFAYDGKERTLSFSSLSHPALSLGNLYYKWYFENEIIGVTESVSVREVSDSGSYKCELTFAYNGDFSYVSTPFISVEILPMAVKEPELLPKVYTGERLYPDIAPSELYYSDFEGGVGAGNYPVTLKLYDGENYCFSSNGGTSVELEFTILRTENSFTSLSVKEKYYLGMPFDVRISALFGDAALWFSKSEYGSYTQEFPSAAGEYYLMAVIAPTENYTGLSSAPIEFTLLIDACVSLTLKTPPDMLTYYAFDSVCLDGISLVASYLSGKERELEASEIGVEYKNGASLAVTDRSVTLSYLGQKCPLSLSVLPCDYDLSGVVFGDSKTVFDGNRHTLSCSLNLVGKDGIPLRCAVKGGGIDAGRYTVSLEFFTDSLNYNKPETLYATLEILPKEVFCEYADLEFVYDGSIKTPTATAYGINSLPLEVVISSVYADAGSYTLTAALKNSNYTLINPSVSFTIKKAPLNLSGAYWSADSFVYSGDKQSVELLGLPSGVFAIGYVDASFVEAGEYLAVAALSYDEKNYSLDTTPSHRWSITPAEYDMASVSFEDSEFVYDGEYHTPNVIGSLPIGKDGSSLKYEFSSRVKDVSGVSVNITVSFTTESKNYKAPESISVSVLILPLSIEVEWEGLSQVYDGSFKLPRALSPYCHLTVSGGGVNAGSYDVKVTPVSKNYTVVNEKETLTVLKCENAFSVQPSVLSCYEGDTPQRTGETKYGTPIFRFYSDIDKTKPISEPRTVGSYYMTVGAEEGENYLSIESEPLAFSILEVLPTAISASLRREVFFAFERLDEADISVYLINNNGSYTYLDFSSVSVTYNNEDGFRFGDVSAVISSGGFSATLSLKVKRADYDMSQAKWVNTSHVYDGTEKTAELVGLPSGVSVGGYTQRSATAAGEYKLSCFLNYDKENYNEPKIPECSLIISKKKVPLPSGLRIEYDREIKEMSISDTEDYFGGSVTAVDSGLYPLKLELKDESNYAFEGGSPYVYLEIMPREITLRVLPDLESYLLDSGTIIDGDDLGVSFEQIGDYVYINVQNPNYRATVIPRNINDKSANLWVLLLIATAAVVLFFLGYTIYKRKETSPRAKPLPKEKKQARVRENAPADKPKAADTLLAVDMAYADTVITDSMARSLIKKCDSEIKSEGRERAKISVGELSMAFSAEERVDINTLKDRMLIPASAGRVKITGGGVIDKPLTVYADSFEPSAVKMIALTGGKCFVCRNKRV